jgi:hypothetical protein
MKPSNTAGSAQTDQTIHTQNTADFSAAALEKLSQWNFEIASLYGKRIQELCAFPFSLMLCTSFDDVTDAQQKYSEILLADYRATAEKMAHTFTGAKSDVRGNTAGAVYAETLLRAQDDARNIIDQALVHAQRIIADAEIVVAKPQAVSDKTRAA